MVGNSPIDDPPAADRCRVAPAPARASHGAADRLKLLKAVADPTRLAVLDTLARCGTRCHCDLEVDLEIPANRLSFHLKVLRDADLVGSRRRGQRVDYHLRDGAIEALHAALPPGSRPTTTASHETSPMLTSAVAP